VLQEFPDEPELQLNTLLPKLVIDMFLAQPEWLPGIAQD